MVYQAPAWSSRAVEFEYFLFSENLKDVGANRTPQIFIESPWIERLPTI